MKLTAVILEKIILNLEVEVAASVMRHLAVKHPEQSMDWHKKWASRNTVTLMEASQKDVASWKQFETEQRTSGQILDLPEHVAPVTWAERTMAMQELWGKWGVSRELTDSILLLLWYKT